jgi:hypothetical protein
MSALLQLPREDCANTGKAPKEELPVNQLNSLKTPTEFATSQG